MPEYSPQGVYRLSTNITERLPFEDGLPQKDAIRHEVTAALESARHR